MADCHPIVQFCYFGWVLFWAMTVQHPVVLGMSLVLSLLTALWCGRKKALKWVCVGIVPSALLVAVLNPLWNHAGVTILGYWPDGNPLTLESVIYGGVAGCLFSSVLLWCVCLRYTFRSDGILYLFGKISPKLSLLLSMVIRFLPQLAGYWHQVRTAQHGLGKDMNQGSFRQRGRHFIVILSSVIGLSLENAVQLSDTMKSRGYGLFPRTSFSLYRFEIRDAVLLTYIWLCGGCIAVAFLTEQLDFYYFPAMTPLTFQLSDVCYYTPFFLLYGLPLFLLGKEVITWRALRSRI